MALRIAIIAVIIAVCSAQSSPPPSGATSPPPSGATSPPPSSGTTFPPSRPEPQCGKLNLTHDDYSDGSAPPPAPPSGRIYTQAAPRELKHACTYGWCALVMNWLCPRGTIGAPVGFKKIQKHEVVHALYIHVHHDCVPETLSWQPHIRAFSCECRVVLYRGRYSLCIYMRTINGHRAAGEVYEIFRYYYIRSVHCSERHLPPVGRPVPMLRRQLLH